MFDYCFREYLFMATPHLVALFALAALKPIWFDTNMARTLRAVLEDPGAGLAVHVEVDPLLVEQFVTRHTCHIVAVVTLITPATFNAIDCGIFFSDPIDVGVLVVMK